MSPMQLNDIQVGQTNGDLYLASIDALYRWNLQTSSTDVVLDRGAITFDVAAQEGIAILGDGENRAWLIDMNSHQEIMAFDTPRYLCCTEFSLSDQFLAFGTDNLLQIWDVNQARLQFEVSPLTNAYLFGGGGEAYLTGITNVEFLTTPAQVVVLNARGLYFYDVATGILLRHSFFQSAAYRYDLAVTQEDNYAFTLQDYLDSSYIDMWNIDIESYVTYVCGLISSDFSGLERQQFDVADNEATCPQFVPTDS